MPVVFRDKGYSFFFYSDEGCPLEPCHIHVRKDGLEAKFWINPTVRVARATNIPSHEITKIRKVIENKKKLIEKSWNEHFSK